jgi:hypothetical protein
MKRIWGEIPFENETILKSFAADPQILDYNTARKLAVIEMVVSGRDEEMGWEGNKIKPEPVVIYGFDNRPKYYDFIVIDAEEQAVGTITAYARRTASSSIRGISREVRDYRGVLSKAGGLQASLFESWDGGSYLGLLGKSGETPEMVINAYTGETAEGITEIEGEEIIAALMESDFVSVLSAGPSPDIVDENDPMYAEIQRAIAAYAETVKTPEEIEASLHAAWLNHNDNAAAFWSVINELLPEIELIEDEGEIIEAGGKGLISFIKNLVVVKVVVNAVQSAVLNVVHTVNTLVNGVDPSMHYIDKYTNYTETFRAGPEYTSNMCGSWACSYLVWIKEDKKKDTYQTFYNLSSSVGEVYVLNFVLRTIKEGRPMTPAEITWALPAVSGGKIWFRDTWEFSDAVAYDHIKNRKKPAILLCRTSSGQLHYKVAVGARASGSAFSETHYFLMHENADKGQNFLKDANGNLKTDTKGNYINKRDYESYYETVGEWWFPWFMVEEL